MRVAIYSSVLYGEDFVKESIESIAAHVDKVFVILMDRPWGNTAGVEYKGSWIKWPKRFDRTEEIVREIEGVEIIKAQKDTPWNRWGFGVNTIVREQRKVETDEIVVLDPDCVFTRAEADKAFTDWQNHPEYQWAAPSQIELWRTPAWQTKRQRNMVLFLRGDLKRLNFPDPPGPPVSHPKINILSAHVHNLGFAVSESTMRWKHLTAMAFSPVVGESIPREDWFENTWKAWHPVTNNKNLDISIGCESGIPCAVPYDVSMLPDSIQKRLPEWPVYQ